MADDSISYDVIVDFVMQNSATSLKQVEEFQASLNDLRRTTDLSATQFSAAKKALDRMATGFQTGLGGVKKYTKGFQELATELQTAQRAFRELAQESAAAGSLTPAKDASGVLDYESAKRYLATYEAANASLLQQSRQVVAATEKERAAQEALNASRARAASSYRPGSFMAQQEAAEQTLKLSAAETTWAKQSKLGEQMAKDTTRAIEEQTNALPRLRYALYDVSSTLTIAGAGMIALAGATVGASVAMDRQFADVLRTTELYADDLKDSAAELRDEFNELFATMPSSWGDLTQIGTLAGQLNIASGSVAEFTRLVAQFAATTDVSIEDSATAFGRLSELLDVPANEFQNLGSSILAVGVNSVATESQIINISTQITSMAASAGFTADQVFGLSSALASLGTQPELSRGVITRLFTNINAAITSGSERLEQFGAQIGKTGAEFADLWSSDASGTLLSLMEGIGSKEGPAAVDTLNELGIVASRDVPTLLRLAQNSDVLRNSLATAAEGYADGTALADQYGVVALTVAERLKVLWNNVQLLFTAFGNTQSILGPVIDRATELVQLFTRIASNPIGQFLSLLGVGVIAAAGALALLAGAATRGLAGLVALRTAMTEMHISAGMGRAQISGLIASLVGLDAAGKSVTGTLVAAGAAMMGIQKGAGLAANASAVLGRVWSVAWPLAAISGGLYLVTKAVGAIGDAMRSNQQVAEDYLGSFTGLDEALAADNAADYAGKKYGEVARALDDTKDSTDEARVAAEEWLGIQRQAPSDLDGTNAKLKEQNIILGENTAALLRSKLAASDAFKEFASNGEIRATAEKYGIDISNFIAAGLEGGDAIDAALAEVNSKIDEAANFEAGGFAESYADVKALKSTREELEDLARVLEGFRGEVAETEAVQDALNAVFGETSDGLEDIGSAASDALSDFFDIQNGLLGVQNSLFGLGEALSENGANFDIFAASGRDNTEALLGAIQAITAESGANVAQAAANLQALFDYITIGGYASAEQLGVLTDAIATLKEAAGDSAIPEQNLQINSFFGGWASGAEKAQKATKKAKQEIITISDYANDLASIWERAFDIRFSGSSTMDQITSSFQSLRDEAAASAERVQGLKQDVADLNQEIKNLNGDIKGLQADRALQEYFLGVANQYGDSKRATQIKDQIRELDQEIANSQAEIAEKQREAAKATEEANKETQSQSKTLTGNSAEAVNNRNTIRDLVAQYQAHIKALADSGLSEDQLRIQTEQLRQDFINQATQLGFNREELGMYAAAFDDVKVAIDNVPRNINVTANVDPALQALAEFEAKARAAAENAADAIATGNGSGYHVPEITLPVRASIEEVTYEDRPLADHIDVLTQQRGSRSRPSGAGRGFASGGYTGAGGKHEPAGIVHRGEYVVRRELVNQRTGLPYADALGRLSKGAPGRTGYAGGGFVSGGSPFNGAVHFDAMGMQQLLTSQQTFVTLSGKTVADASSREYSNSSALGGA